MAYTTVNKIKSMFRGIEIEASDTALTISEVDDFIVEIDSVIDGRLANYYEIPITGVESLKTVGLISKLLVSGMVADVLRMSGSKESYAGSNYTKRGKELLNSIAPEMDCSKKCATKPTVKLPDATPIAIPPEHATTFSYNFEGTPQIFKKDEPAW